MTKAIFLALSLTLAVAAQPATERLPGLETVHGMLDNGPGQKVQTILTRPEKSLQPLPAMLIVGWLSCDTVEILEGVALDGMGQLIRHLLIDSKMVVLRVEKPGLGKSEGKCGDTDFETELAGYRAGLAMLRNHPWVDRNRIVLLGMSNGAGVLPLVTSDAAAYISINGWSKTWLEHMLDTLRRQDEISGKTPAEVTARMQGFAELYADYLQEKKLPGDIVKAKPHLAKLWTDEPARQYGRPSAFYHQLQALNLAEAWSRVSAPTLAIWGEHDFLMSRDDHERIVALVNRNRPGAARLVVMPKMHHVLFVHDTIEQAMRDDPSGRFAAALPTIILQWMNGVV